MAPRTSSQGTRQSSSAAPEGTQTHAPPSPALVTNPHRSIGLGVAEAFISSGAHVHIIGATAANLAAALALLKDEYPDPALSITGATSDVLDESAITNALRSIAPVDHIVYTAVDARIRGPIGGVDIPSAQALFGVKFWGQVAVAKGALFRHHQVS